MVDFHNYTYSILALALSNNHPLVKFTKFAEKVFGSRCDSGLCVTRAMQEDLVENWNIKATVLYDRPPSRFHPIDNQTRHKLFYKQKLIQYLVQVNPIVLCLLKKVARSLI